MIQLVLGIVAGIGIDGAITYAVAMNIKKSQSKLVTTAVDEFESKMLSEIPKFLAIMEAQKSE
jgi:enoyl-[acyl-carrier-protein] reductase (NADH)